MYLTAQRPVLDEAFTWPGINAYLYQHGLTWGAHPPPNLPAAAFARGHECMPYQPGRPILSYLDILTPDDATALEIKTAAVQVHGIVSQVARPWTFSFQRSEVRFSIDSSLDQVWSAEFHLLLDEVERLLVDPTYRTL